MHTLAIDPQFVFYEKIDIAKYVVLPEQIKREYLGARREGIISARLYSTMAEFFEEGTSHTDSQMDMVNAYLEANFHKNILLSNLAELCHMSKSAFCKSYKEHFGYTAFERLMDIRLQNAAMILKLHPEKKIYTVSAECGFSDIGYFCKAFKKRFGITPSEARELI